MCFECANSPPHQGHESKLKVADFTKKALEQVSQEVAALANVKKGLEQSKVAKIIKAARNQIRSYFGKLHEMLNDLECQKVAALDSMISEMCGSSFDIEEASILHAVGTKHQECLQRAVSSQTFIKGAQDVLQRIGHYVKDAHLYNKEAKSFLDKQATGGKFDKLQKIVSYRETEVRQTLQNLVNESIQLQRSEKERRIASEGDIRDPAKYEFRKAIETVHKAEVSCIERLKNDSLATGSLDTKIKLWDENTGEIFKSFEGHNHQVMGILELSNGDLVSSSMDKTVNVWDRKRGDILFTHEGQDNIKQMLELDSDHLVLLAEDDNGIIVWEYKNDKNDDNYTYFEDHKDVVNKVIVVMKKYLFSASTDHTIKRWSLKRPNASATFKGHTEAVLTLAYLDDNLLASGSADGTVRIWDVASSTKNIYVLEGHESYVTDLSYIEE